VHRFSFNSGLNEILLYILSDPVLDEERKEVKKAVGEALEANFSELEELASKKAESESKKEADESEATKDGINDCIRLGNQTV
jgi:hypothetical protein